MTNKNSIIQSLKLRDELNPEVWDKNQKGKFQKKNILLKEQFCKGVKT